MKNIEINIGNTCNNECKFCMSYYEKRSGFIDYLTIKKELIRARKQGFDAIGFLGGEFTLHPQALDIIKLCKLLGFKIIHIVSNGRKYKDKEFLQQLIKNGANRFSVSVHSHKAKVEDFLTQRKGGFNEKISGLKNLINYQKQGLIPNLISVNIVINALNYREILNTLKYFNRLGIKDFRLNFIWLEGRAKKNKELYLKYSDFLPYIDKIINLSKKNKFNLAFEGIPICLIRNKEKIKYFGELRDKSTEVITFNIPEVRDQFNWQEKKKSILKMKHKKCNKCQWDILCDGVWREYIKNYGWQEFNF